MVAADKTALHHAEGSPIGTKPPFSGLRSLRQKNQAPALGTSACRGPRHADRTDTLQRCFAIAGRRCRYGRWPRLVTTSRHRRRRQTLCSLAENQGEEERPHLRLMWCETEGGLRVLPKIGIQRLAGYDSSSLLFLLLRLR